MLLAKRFDNVLVEAEAREHAPVRGDEVETVGIALATKFVGKLPADRKHRVTHLAKLGFPLRAQGGIVQDDPHEGRAMVRREGVVETVQDGQVAADDVMLLGAGADRHGASHTVAVEAEILRT